MSKAKIPGAHVLQPIVGLISVDDETPKMAKKYNFLKEGDVLTEEYIKKLPTLDQQEVANQLNRRTEFKVLKTDYQLAPTGAPAPTGGASTPPKPKAEPTE